MNSRAKFRLVLGFYTGSVLWDPGPFWLTRTTGSGSYVLRGRLKTIPGNQEYVENHGPTPLTRAFQIRILHTLDSRYIHIHVYVYHIYRMNIHMLDNIYIYIIHMYIIYIYTHMNRWATASPFAKPQWSGDRRKHRMLPFTYGCFHKLAVL